MIDKDKLIETAKNLDMEIAFDTPDGAGVYDIHDGSLISYRELFKDVFGDDETKYQVEWKNDRTKEHSKHGVFDTYEEAMDSIYEWWEENEFIPPYIRRWTKDGVTTIDYGLHDMFYYIVEGIFKEK